MLKRLAQRVRQISSRKLGFPHEIGVFLGYPKEDVEGLFKMKEEVSYDRILESI